MERKLSGLFRWTTGFTMTLQTLVWQYIDLTICICLYVDIWVGLSACVEERKISYFVLARNLIQHLISPNQDDLSYSARTFISG